jgi:hypothetical protein
MEHARSLEHHQKIKCMNHGYREEVKTKGLNNLFNNILAEIFPNLEKGKDILEQEATKEKNCSYIKANSSE